MSQSRTLPPGNLLLAALPSEEFNRFSDQLEVVSLNLGVTLYIPEEPITYVYFPTEGIVSLLAVLEGGESVETGVVGREGMVGFPVVFGAYKTTNQALVQGSGSALRMRAKALNALIKNGGPLHDILLRYIYTIFTQISQTAAYNRVHPLNERLARFLLLTPVRINMNHSHPPPPFLLRMLRTLSFTLL